MKAKLKPVIADKKLNLYLISLSLAGDSIFPEKRTKLFSTQNRSPQFSTNLLLKTAQTHCSFRNKQDKSKIWKCIKDSIFCGPDIIIRSSSSNPKPNSSKEEATRKEAK
jgi:hypothetical protein